MVCPAMLEHVERNNPSPTTISSLCTACKWLWIPLSLASFGMLQAIQYAPKGVNAIYAGRHTDPGTVMGMDGIVNGRDIGEKGGFDEFNGDIATQKTHSKGTEPNILHRHTGARTF